MARNHHLHQCSSNISYKMAQQTGDKELQEKVKQALGYDALSLDSNAFWYATQVGVIGEVYLGGE